MMRFTHEKLDFSCVESCYPNFCAGTILHNFYSYGHPANLKEAGIDPTEFLNEILSRLESECSALYMADVVGGFANSYIFPMFEDGEFYGEWRCQKSEPYYNINSGNEVQHLVFYWTGTIERCEDDDEDDEWNGS